MLNATCALAEEFDNDDWQEIRRQKQGNTYKEESIPVRRLNPLVQCLPVRFPLALIPAILSDGIEMPYESKLAISGRKYIRYRNFPLRNIFTKRDDDLKSPTAGGFELDQQLQVRVKVLSKENQR